MAALAAVLVTATATPPAEALTDEGLSPLVAARRAAVDAAHDAEARTRAAVADAHTQRLARAAELHGVQGAAREAGRRAATAVQRRDAARARHAAARESRRRAGEDLELAGRVWDRRVAESRRRTDQLRETAVSTSSWSAPQTYTRLAMVSAVSTSDGGGEALHRVAQLRRAAANHGSLAVTAAETEVDQRHAVSTAARRLGRRLDAEASAETTRRGSERRARRAHGALRDAEQRVRTAREAAARADRLVAERAAAAQAAAVAVPRAEAALAGSGWLAGVPGGAGLVWPVDGAPGSGFGPRLHPVHGGVRRHAGVDVGGRTGQAVVAAVSGRVEAAGLRGGYGNAVVIAHSGGRRTLYGHLSRVDVAPGQRVSQAQLIGAVGSTGVSTGPHLHFELHRGGVAVDPLLAFTGSTAR